MNIVRGTVQEWTSLDKIRAVFGKKGFEDIEEDDEGLTIAIVDNEDLGKDFLKIIPTTEDYSRYYRYLEGAGGAGISYLLLIKDFNEFVFVRETITTLGKKRIEKFKFYRDDPKRSSLEKLNDLAFNNLESFENLFDTKAVVNEFYEEYKRKRDKLVSKIQGIKEKEDKEKYAQVIFDRFIFLHFIQEKGFLSDDKRFLINKYGQIKKEKKNYFEDFLKFLFFDVLNTPLDKRNLKHMEYKDIPFLNGGLFREHRIEIENPKIWISNDILEEIIYFLGDWYWYVDESSDFGEDKALSPEILCHIFEKTITGQKEKGAYYTPEEVTRYISEHILYPYCIEKINLKFNKKYIYINDLFEVSEVNEIEYLYFDILKKITILDNAVGSGAFLLSAQKILLELMSFCYDELINLSSKKIIDEQRQAQLHNSTSYYLKKRIISTNLFGVDIEEGAIEICKLRLWLSLISEFDKKSVEPLPNIDYNILCGNSLFGFIEPPKEEQLSLIDSKRISDIFKEINKKKELFRQESDPTKAKSLKNQIDQFLGNNDQELNKKYLNQLRNKKVNISESDLLKITPFHWGLKFDNIFFNSEHNRGFDIIIGNPPWGAELTKLDKSIIDLYFSSMRFEYNSFTFFVERSIQLLKKEGYFSYILPKNLMRSNTYSILRKKIIDESQILELLDLGPNVFIGVTSESCVIILKKIKSSNYEVKCYNQRNITGIKELNNFYNLPIRLFNELRENTFNIYLTKENEEILTEIERNSTPLGTIGNFIVGIAAGNEKKYCTFQKNNNMCKPIIRGKNVKKYRCTYDGEYILYDKNKLHRPREESEFLANEKLVSLHVNSKLVFAYDNQQYYTMQTINQMTLKNNKYSIKELLLILNSKLLNFYYGIKINMASSITTAISIINLEFLPIKLSNYRFYDAIADYLIKENPDTDEYKFVEELVQSCIFELYFGEILSTQIQKLVNEYISKKQINLTIIKQLSADKKISHELSLLKENKMIKMINEYFAEQETIVSDD